MNINYLVAFVTVVQEGSISKAAKELHLTQPALSSQIQTLENTFQIKLLDRTNKGVHLTEAGETLLYYAKRILTLSDNLNGEIERLKSFGAEELSIGASTTIGGYALPCSIHIFKEKYPNAKVKMTVSKNDEIMQSLMDRTIAFGMIDGPVFKKDLMVSPVAQDELVMVVPPHSEWAKQDIISLEELKSMPLLLREEGSGTRKVIEKAFSERGINLKDLKIILELNHVDAIKSSVETGRGVSILSRLAIKKELYTGTLKALKIEGISLRYDFNVVYLPKTKRTLTEKRFLKFIMSPKERGFC